jgi:SAM-dependent methyltransferase
MSFFPHDLAAPAAARGPAVEWEEVNCLLCGGGSWSPLLEAQDNVPGGTGLWFFVVQCQDCGLCFTNPRPSPRCMGPFYNALYPAHRTPGERRRHHWWNPLLRWLRRPRRDRRLPPLQGQGRLLDFGCGGGSFLDRMRRQGWQVTGLDNSPRVVRRLRGELGLEVFNGSLPNPDLRPGSFDLVTMWQSLEHVHAPLDVLREAYRLLVPGGKLLVSVPNIDSLPFRWFGHVWYGLDLPRHLTHFAPWTLHLMLHRAGFRVGPIRSVRHSSWLRRSARRACRSPLATRRHRWLKNKLVASVATWYGYLTNQSDCIMVVAER